VIESRDGKPKAVLRGVGPERHEERGVNRNIVETIVGALVLLVAGVFVFLRLREVRSARGPDGYEITPASAASTA
jgi:hypothetical protein